MNYKLLSIPTTLFASALVLAVACEPCVGDECDFDDDGGGEGGAPEATGGASGGTSSGGAVGTGGSPAGGEGGLGGTTQTLDCLGTGVPSGTRGSCEPVADEETEPGAYACQACAQMYCCDEVEVCAAEDPLTACYFGSTSRLGFDEEPIVGEFDCILDCLRNLPYEEFLGDQAEVDACALECGSAECDEDQAGPASAALAACLLGVNNDVAPAGCQEECALVPEP